MKRFLGIRILLLVGSLVIGVGSTGDVFGDASPDERNPKENSLRQKLEFIAAANSSALERIRTVDAEYTRRRFIVDGEQSKELLDRNLHVWWWKDGDLNRLKYYLQGTQPDQPAKKSGFVDTLLTVDTLYILTDYNWETSPSLTLGPHHEIYAEINHARTDAFFQIDPMFDLGFHVQDKPIARNLEELLRAVNYKADLTDVSIGRAGKEHSGYKIHLQTPEDHCDITVVVDPAANYLVQSWTIASTRK